MYSTNDYRDYLEHSWGKKPEQKAREKEYNHNYYQQFKDKWKEYARNKLGVAAKENYDRAKANKEFWDDAAERADNNVEDLELDYQNKLADARYYDKLAQEESQRSGDRNTARWREYISRSMNNEYEAENRIKPEAEKWKKNSDKTNEIRDRVVSEYKQAGYEYLNTPLAKAYRSDFKIVRAGAKFIEDKLKKG